MRDAPMNQLDVADTASVVARARRRWTVTFSFLVLGAFALVVGHLGLAGIVVAVLALVPIIVVHRMRLSADAHAVTVVNLAAASRIPWSEISDFRMGRVALSTCLDVCKRDGTRIHSWVVTTTGAAAYSSSTADDIISDLRDRLMLATGESQDDLDARALEDALAAADAGRYSLASALVAEGRVDSLVMADKLLERSRSRRNDVGPDS